MIEAIAIAAFAALACAAAAMFGLSVLWLARAVAALADAVAAQEAAKLPARAVRTGVYIPATWARRSAPIRTTQHNRRAAVARLANYAA